MKQHNANSGRRMLRYTTAIASAALLTAGLGACAGTTPESDPPADGELQTFTVLEATPGFFDLPIRNAMADFDEEFGLNIEVTTVDGGGAVAQQFLGGTADVAVTAVDIPLRLQMQDGIPGGVSVIGSNMAMMLYVLAAKADSPYESIADIEGANIGITGPKSASELVVRWAMKTEFDMDPQNSEFVALGAVPTILEAIRNGSVDAGTLFAPALELGLASGDIKIIHDFRDSPNGQNVFFARNNDLDADSSKFEAFMNAYSAAVQKMKDDPDYAFSTAKEAYGDGLSDEIIQEVLDFYMTKEWANTEFTEDVYNASREVLLNSDSGFEESTFPSFDVITQNAPGQ